MTVRVARMTPAGTGAVATIAVVGSESWPLIQLQFRARRKATSPPPPGSLLLGNFGEPPGDDVVVSVRSGTAIPWFEVHCHGGPQVVTWLLEQLVQHGAAIVPWTELEALNCRDRTSAAALAALPHALTARAATVLLDQYHGALADSVRDIVARFDAHQPDTARFQLQQLASFVGIGRHLTQPWRVALCGPPNAGKSSIVNALAGFQRAVVTPIPGTTRDVVTTLVALDGWPVELADTAGVRRSSDPLEEAGIRLGLESAHDSDLVLWVTEPGHREESPPGLVNVLNVFNKCDLSNDDESGGTRVSATTGYGLAELIAEMVRRQIPENPMRGAAVPFTPQLADTVLAAQQSWNAGDLVGARELLAELISPADSA